MPWYSIEWIKMCTEKEIEIETSTVRDSGYVLPPN